jgi:serine/threonine protein phosphatase PrpC
MSGRGWNVKRMFSGNGATETIMRLGQCMIPHGEKVHYGGEDGCFISESDKAFGVTDGVGGWASSGINPAVFARKMMEFSKDEFRRHNKHILKPVE